MLTFYGYPKCSTCVNAKKFLAKLGFKMNAIDITTSPPSAEELRGRLRVLQYHIANLRRADGVGGLKYRSIRGRRILPA